MEISKDHATELIYEAIQEYRQVPISQAKWELGGMVRLAFQLNLITQKKADEIRRNINMIKPWDGKI